MGKGQISVYIIIGVIIVIVSVILILTQNKVPTNQLSQPAAIEQKSYIQSCLDQGAVNGLEEFGLQGSIFEGDVSMIIGDEIIVVWFDKTPLIATKDAWLNDLARIIAEETEYCVQLDGLGENSTIYLTEPIVKLQELGNKTLVKLNWQVEVKEGKTTQKLSDWETTLNLPIGKVYEDTVSIVKMLDREKKELDVDTLLDTYGETLVRGAGEGKFIFEMFYPYEENVYIYRFGARTR